MLNLVIVLLSSLAVILEINMRDWSLVELIVGIIIVGCAVVMLTLAFMAARDGKLNTDDSDHWSNGYNGVVEQRCIRGLMFLIDNSGSTIQVIDENGHGVRC